MFGDLSNYALLCTRKQTTYLFPHDKMKEKTKRALKGIGYTALCVTSVIGAGVISFVVFNNPSKVEHPCLRTFTRLDGIPKKAFDSRMAANLQSVIQLIRYGEVCNPYMANGKYYTGHSNKAWVRNINIFK